MLLRNRMLIILGPILSQHLSNSESQVLILKTYSSTRPSFHKSCEYQEMELNKEQEPGLLPTLSSGL